MRSLYSLLPNVQYNSTSVRYINIDNSGSGGLVTQSCQILVTRWIVPFQAPLSMGFPRQEYWSGLPFPSSGDLPKPGIEPRSLGLQVVSCIAGEFFTDWAHQGSINSPMHVVIRDKVARVFLCVHICILLSIDILQGFVQLLLKGMIKITKQFTKPYWGAVKSWHFWTGLSSSQLSVEIIEDSTCCYTPYFPHHNLSQILKSSCSTYLLLLQ